MPVPNTNDFSLQTVVDEINPYTDDLSGCFFSSVGSLFDPMYRGAEDRLSNFRNYGHTAALGDETDVWNVNERFGFDEAPLLIDQVPGQPQFLAAIRNPLPVEKPDNSMTEHSPHFKGATTYLALLAVTDDGTIFNYDKTLSFTREYPTDLIIVDNEYCVFATQVYSSIGNLEYYRIRIIKFSTSSIVTIDTITFSVNSTIYPNNVRLAVDKSNNLYVANVTNVTKGSPGTNYVYRYYIGIDTGSFPFERAFSTATTALTITSVVGDMYVQDEHLFLSRIVSGSDYINAFSIGSSPNGNLTFISAATTFDLIEDMDGNKSNLLFFISREDIYCYSWNGSVMTYEDIKVMASAPKIFISVCYSELNNVIVTSNEDVIRSYRMDASKDFILEGTILPIDEIGDNQRRRAYCVRNNFHKSYLLTGMWDTLGSWEGYDPSGVGGDYQGAYLKTFEIE